MTFHNFSSTKTRLTRLRKLGSPEGEVYRVRGVRMVITKAEPMESIRGVVDFRLKEWRVWEAVEVPSLTRELPL